MLPIEEVFTMQSLAAAVVVLFIASTLGIAHHLLARGLRDVWASYRLGSTRPPVRLVASLVVGAATLALLLILGVIR